MLYIPQGRKPILVKTPMFILGHVTGRLHTDCFFLNVFVSLHTVGRGVLPSPDK